MAEGSRAARPGYIKGEQLLWSCSARTCTCCSTSAASAHSPAAARAMPRFQLSASSPWHTCKFNKCGVLAAPKLVRNRLSKAVPCQQSRLSCIQC